MYILMGNNMYTTGGGINDAEGIFKSAEEIKVNFGISAYDNYSILNMNNGVMVSVDLEDIDIQDSFNIKDISFEEEMLSKILQELSKLTDNIRDLNIKSCRYNSVGLVGVYRAKIYCGSTDVLIYKFIDYKFYS